MENQTLSEEKPVNKNRPLIIIVAVVLALCCCLVVVAVVGFYSFTRITSVETSQTEPFEEFILPSDADFDGPPEGGLANDILKNDTWQVMAPAAAGFGCEEPSGVGMKIEVLQQPSDGTWVEKWPVMCQSGEVYEFEVEFVLDDGGATFNFRLIQ